jgi:signal transduction histidine kinase
MARALLPPRQTNMTARATDHAGFEPGGRESGRAPGVEEPPSWYREDWVLAVVGLVVLVTILSLIWEVGLRALGLHVDDPGQHAAMEGRSVTIALAAAAWAGWRVRLSERRLAAAGERLREGLAVQRWRAHQAEGLAAFSRILAHELRNPLHGMALHATVIKRSAGRMAGPEADGIRAAANVLEEQVGRVDRLLDDYLAYGKGSAQAMVPEPVALDLLAREAIELHRPTLEVRRVTFDLRRAEGLPHVHVDRARLLQALDHLLVNAIEGLSSSKERSVAGGGHIELDVAADGEQVVLTIADDGPGFEDPEAVFRPFFTSGSAGAGLGLAVVRDIVRAHRGEVSASNVDERGGARVEIRLPAGGIA